jgi:Ca-activated chloride channel homolog
MRVRKPSRLRALRIRRAGAAWLVSGRGKALRLAAAVLLLAAYLPIRAQELPTTRILFLVDASQSMADRWGSASRMQAAQEVIQRMVDTLSRAENLEMALRVYGHLYYQGEFNCQDSRLEVGFRAGNAGAIKSRIRDIKPRGITPIGYSLAQSATDFPPDPDSRNILILITDGVESCQRDPCLEMEMLRSRNVITRAFVIGLGMDPSTHSAFGCIGEFYNAAAQNDLGSVLERTLQVILSRTVLRVDLLDEQGRPSETNMNMSFYGSPGGGLRYNFYHTLNDRGEPDTFYVDPILDYRLVVHSIPPVDHSKLEIRSNALNVARVPVPRGALRLGTLSNAFPYRLQALVYRSGSRETLHVQDFNTEQLYLTGKYDLEILTLPRIDVRGLELKQDQITTFEIPAPGYVTFARNHELIGSVLTRIDGELQEVYQLSSLPRNETIALQPGRYLVIYRGKQSRLMQSSQVREFEVVAGSSSTIKL